MQYMPLAAVVDLIQIARDGYHVFRVFCICTFCDWNIEQNFISEIVLTLLGFYEANHVAIALWDGISGN